MPLGSQRLPTLMMGRSHIAVIHNGGSMGRHLVPLVVRLASPAVAALGGAVVVLGEVDDSPGAMLIGLLLVLTAVAVNWKVGAPGRSS